MAETNTSLSATRPWPDLSSYGLFFGVTSISGVGARLVMVDERGVWADFAKEIGFKPSELGNVFVKDDFTLTIPNIASRFPGAQTKQLTNSEIRDQVATRLAFLFPSPPSVPHGFLPSGAQDSARGVPPRLEEAGTPENRWQVPYVPASGSKTSGSMCPRNLSTPIRNALSRVEADTGMSVDDYVCSRLKWSREEMQGCLDADQVDATALAIYQIERNKAFINADATGMGKGRVLAATARYAKLQGMDVVFFTENTPLFRDFYRDIDAIGSRHLFSRPFVINAETQVLDMMGVPLGSSLSADDACKVLSSGKFPDAYDLVLATYSQFASADTDDRHITRHLAAIDAIAAVRSGESRSEVLHRLSVAESLGLDDASIPYDNSLAISYIKGLDPIPDHLSRQLRYREMSAADLLNKLESMLLSSWAGIRQMWLRSRAATGNALLILDESHNAAGPKSNTHASLINAVQNAAAVVYSSATFAKDTKHYDIYTRAIPSSISLPRLKRALSKGGVPLQEVFSSMLASDGLLIRREHDLLSLSTRLVVDENRKVRNTDWSNRMAKVLYALSALSEQIEKTADGVANFIRNDVLESKTTPYHSFDDQSRIDVPRINIQTSSFGSLLYGISQAFNAAIESDIAADVAISSLRDGWKPIIAFENTFESSLAQLLASPASFLAPNFAHSVGDQLADDGSIDSPGNPNLGRPVQGMRLKSAVGLKDVLLMRLDKMFDAVCVLPHVSADKTNASRISLLDLDTVRDAQAVSTLLAMRDQVRNLIQSLPHITASPIDNIIEQIEKAGYSVGELSGRRHKLVKGIDDTYIIEAVGPNSKTAVEDGFNNGHYDALLTSRSGSTGISLHSSPTFSDQRPRDLIDFQPNSDVSVRQQTWGRHNRKGQVHLPRLTFVSSGLPGSTRRRLLQNAGLRKLSAHTTANADHSALDENTPDILNRVGNEVCYRWLSANPDVAKPLLGIDLSEKGLDEINLSGTYWVDYLTSRITMLDVATQERVFDEIYGEYNALLSLYDMEDRNLLKAKQLDIRADFGECRMIDAPETESNSVFATPVYARELLVRSTIPPLDPDEIRQLCRDSESRIARLAGDNWSQNTLHLLDDECERLLPSIKPERYLSVESAMESTTPNCVKTTSAQRDWLHRFLPRISPGSVVAVKSGYGDGACRLNEIVTDLVIPEHGLTSLASYRVTLLGIKSHKFRTVSLLSLWMQKDHFDVILSTTDPHYAISEKLYFMRLKQPSDETETRVILDGNLLQASHIAADNGVGQAVTYSDKHGEWHRGIILPRGMGLDAVLALPVEVTCAAAMYALLNKGGSGSPVVLSDSLRPDQQSYAVTLDDGVVYLSAYGGQNTSAWLTSNYQLSRYLAGNFTGTPKHRSAVVLEHKLSEFCEAFISVARSRGVRVIAPGALRDRVLPDSNPGGERAGRMLDSDLLDHHAKRPARP